MTESPHEVSREAEISNPLSTRPHIVVLGAGASIAALPSGDRSGKPLPDMKGLAALPDVAAAVRGAGLDPDIPDFETFYSALRISGSNDALANEIDAILRSYFADIEIVDEPTIYDYLLLSLRPADVVATFNWDPLIAQARDRLWRLGFTAMPEVVYLHGNVAIGICEPDRLAGPAGQNCIRCGKPLQPVPLLYPVEEKNYESDPYIQDSWNGLDWGLRNALFFTIFGYRAPSSDVAAIDAFRKAWGKVEERQFEEVEVIARPRSDHAALREKWDPFIHTHHYRIIEDYFESWIANHPRRSIEAYLNQFIFAKFIDVNPAPRGVGLPELVEWFSELLSYEGPDNPPPDMGRG